MKNKQKKLDKLEVSESTVGHLFIMLLLYMNSCIILVSADDYTPVIEFILNAVSQILESVYQLEDRFPYPLSNLTVKDVKMFLKKQTISFNFDSTSGMKHGISVLLVLLNIGDVQYLYKLAVLLFIYFTTVDMLLHCSPTIAMSKQSDE